LKTCAVEKRNSRTQIIRVECRGLGHTLGSIMMKRETIAIADIYVPIKRRATLEQKRVNEIAASILDKGL
jgi:hypothetical protein